MFISVKPPKILVVDDEPDVVMIISKYLKYNEYNVITAANGKEALEKVVSEKPDLVLLDALMPVMNGFETLERLRKHPDIKDLAVIMLTACDRKQDIDTALAYGVVDYITKPFELIEVLEKITQALQSKCK